VRWRRGFGGFFWAGKIGRSGRCLLLEGLAGTEHDVCVAALYDWSVGVEGCADGQRSGLLCAEEGRRVVFCLIFLFRHVMRT
jgi:hypothetical protein